MYSVAELKEKARVARCDVLKALHVVGSGHPGGCLSAIDIFVTLYFHVMKIDPKNPKWEDRDRFLLSKGHAAPALFAVLAQRGYFDIHELLRVRKHDGMLQAPPNLQGPGGDSVSGSLGQNMSLAIGTALAGRMDGKDYRTFVMMGDGEMQEGQNWEALMMAPVYKLGNLIAILDENEVQMCGTVGEILQWETNAADKFRAFGWNVIEVDGHDIEALIKVFDSIPNKPVGQPTMIVAHTVKGKGVSFMEGKAAWHGGSPNKEQMEQIAKELGGGTL